MIDVQATLKEFSAVKVRRSPWESIWELCAKYALQRKIGFTTVTNPGDFYTATDVYDNTANRALKTMCSSLYGALWKNGARTFQLHKPRKIRETKAVKDYYEEVNARVTWQMEHEKAGLGIALDEYFMENGAFGTAAIGVFEAPSGSVHKLEYRSMGLKNLYIVEDVQGRVYKLFFELKLKAQQIQAEYGSEVLTDKIKAALEKNDFDTEFPIVWVIRPRDQYNSNVLNQKNLAYESVHILVDEKVVIRESGFRGIPVVVQRFYKNDNEEYGRCPTTEGLFDIIELNALVEMLTNGSESALFPTWWILDDGSFGSGSIDRSPRGVIPLDPTMSKISGLAPMGQVGQVGDMNPALKLAQDLVEKILAHYFVDKLTDLNNKTRMTLGEAQIRNELRADSMGGVYYRQMNEMFIPLIRRSIEILRASGELGVTKGSVEERMVFASGKVPLYIPAELVEMMKQGEEIFEIKFISPAARILRAEELRGAISTWQFARAFADVAPELILQLDKKRSLALVNELQGPAEIILSEEEFEKELVAFQQSQQLRTQIQTQAAGADIAAKSASAKQMEAQADMTRGEGANLMAGIL